MKTLYKSNKGRLQQWSIGSDGFTIIIQYGVFGGTIQEATEEVTINQSGRSLDEQVTLRINARVSQQIDAGYASSIEDAIAQEGRNALSLHRPMLAQPLKFVKNIDISQCLVQYKYNGHRCLITNLNGELFAYSRNGKPITTIKHILDKMSVPKGVTLDGELYAHGNSLQTIASWVKREQKETEQLQFICYDAMLSANYSDRLEYIQSLELGDSSYVAPTNKITCLKDQLAFSLSMGYEGLILRTNDTAYEAGVRSYSLVKVKQVMNGEFVVKDIVPSKDGWGILVCMLPTGNTFRVSAPGTMADKHHVYQSKDLYIGKLVTIEFFELTKDGVPFHPVAINFRGDL